MHQLGCIVTRLSQNKMKLLVLLLLFCDIASPVKHTLKFFFTASSGVPNFPDLVSATVVDEHPVAYCDTNKKVVEPKQEWMKKLFENNPRHLEWYNQECFKIQPNQFKAKMESLRQRFSQSGGDHILQRIYGCEWDDETNEENAFNQYGYNGEDYISLDVNTYTWIAPKPRAVITKLIWDAEKARKKCNQMYLTQICPEFLTMYVAFAKSFLLRTEHPSVSLLQKSPSSPVSCHATGFYPNRAMMFWRKDGEEIHENVNIRKILPNHDGNFQMSADLNVSSVTPEDWRRYDCVFHLSGVKDDIVTKLDKAVIRTNWEKPSDMTVPITAAVAVFALILIAASGFTFYKWKTAKSPPPPPDSSSELTENLNPSLVDQHRKK